MFRLAFVVVIVAALLTGCCGQITQQAVEQTTGVKVEQGSSGQPDKVTIKGKDGESLTISSEVPAELKNFPVPAGFKLEPTGGGSLQSGADKTSVATWKAKANVDDVVAFYKQQMASQGYKEEMAMTSSDGGVLVYSKGDSSVTVTLGKEGDTLNLAVMMGKSSSASSKPKP